MTEVREMAERTDFHVVKAAGLTENELDHLVKKTATAFASDPSFGFLFHSPELLEGFIRVCMDFYYRSGQMYVCRNEQEEMSGLSWWVGPDGEKFDKNNMKKYGVQEELTRLMRSLPPRTLFRLARLSAVTEKSHIKQAHSYLVLIAAFQKGAGSALMSDYIAAHPQEVLYLENSNIPANTDFYLKYGFRPLPPLRCGSLSVLPMIKD